MAKVKVWDYAARVFLVECAVVCVCLLCRQLFFADFLPAPLIFKLVPVICLAVALLYGCFFNYMLGLTKSSAVTGYLAGRIIRIILFVVLFLEQWKKRANRPAGVLGTLCAAAALAVFGADNLGIPAMALILVLYKPVVTALRKARLVPESQTGTQTRKLGAGFLLFSLALLATFVTIALVLMGIL